MMKKTRILSLLLSVIMVLSICAAPISAVFAEESTDASSSDPVTAGWASSEDFVESVVDFARTGDYGQIINGKMATTVINLIFGTPESSITSKDLYDKLIAMDQKIDTYHSELVNLLKTIGIKNEIRNYDITMLELFSRRAGIHVAIKSVKEDEEIAKMKDGTEQQKKAAKDNLIKYYKSIIATCEKADLLNKYDDAIALVTRSTSSTTKAFEGAYQLMANNTDDADKLAESYRKYIYSQMNELGMAYMDVQVYWKAMIKLQELDPSAVQRADLQGQLELRHNKLKNLVETEFKAAEERYGGIKKATVESVKSGTATVTKNYHNFADAWKAAKNNLNNGYTVTFTLHQGWFAKDQKGFVDKEPFTDTDKAGCFTSKGEMIIPSGTLTINLNGHKISAESLNLNIFQVSSGANVTINGLPASQLQKTQVQGLYDGKSAITYAGGDRGNVTINLNNVWMKNFKEYGIDAGYDTSMVNLNYNGGGIDNTKNGAIRLRGNIKFGISNCEFNNNQSGNGGGAFTCEKVSSDEGGWIKSCTFNNNSGSQAGAIKGSSRIKINVEGCTFKKNASKDEGGAISIVSSIKDCTFTENSAAKSGGAVWYVGSIDHCTFTGNESNDEGGAVKIGRNDRVSIKNSTFTNNRSKTNRGGAIYYNENTIEIDGCTFEKNSAKLNGGAVYTCSSADLVVKNSTFTGNTVENCGGAICTRNRCRALIENSQFTGNSSTKWDGGALFLTGLYSQYHSLTNVTITGNTAAHRGGGVYCHKDGLKTADFDAKGKVVIDGNTAQNKQNNVLLEQAGGTKECVIDADGLDTGSSKIGISTDCKNRLKVVKNAANASPFYGDNGREILGSSGNLKIKELPGGCK